MPGKNSAGKLSADFSVAESYGVKEHVSDMVQLLKIRCRIAQVGLACQQAAKLDV